MYVVFLLHDLLILVPYSFFSLKHFLSFIGDDSSAKFNIVMINPFIMINPFSKDCSEESYAFQL